MLNDAWPVTLEVWWAGYKIQSAEIMVTEVPDKLAEYKEHVKKLTLTHVSCGVALRVDELCIDMRLGDDVIALASYKNKS